MEKVNFEKISIKSIKIPTPFVVGDVWAYLIQSDDEAVLIDCGPKTELALKTLHDFFKAEKFNPDKLTQIWLTHAHPDHHGAAKVLAEDYGPQIVALNESLPYLMQTENYEGFRKFFESHGIPKDWIANFEYQYEWFKQFMDDFEPDILVKDGDFLTCGHTEFKVYHVPGHAWGHAVFECIEEPVVFAGDVLIEHISSNALIAFDQVTGERRLSLLDLRDSMKRIASMKKLVFPGHGELIYDALAVCEKHFHAHELRKHRILKLLAEPKTLLELTQLLFPFAKEPKMSYLPISEVVGYLDWLMHEGEIVREGGDLFRYVQKRFKV
jgi:glyoxylase-like metal-dependent hydrolase (beta-lactamase superfamily II)